MTYTTNVNNRRPPARGRSLSPQPSGGAAERSQAPTVRPSASPPMQALRHRTVSPCPSSSNELTLRSQKP